jgi:hypothetical protein
MGTKLALGVGALAVILVAGILIGKYGPWQAKAKTRATGVLQAEGSRPTTGLLQAEGSKPATGIAQAEGSPPPERKMMPEDIRKWLEHLERIEKQRVDMAKDQISSLMVAMTKLSVSGGADNLERIMAGEDPKAPHEDLSAQANTMRSEWNGLIQRFRSFPPPQRCRQLAETYDRALVATSLSLLTVTDALGKASSDLHGALSSVQRMQGESYQSVDVPAASSDNQLAEICREYDTDKWFVIHADIAGQIGSIGRGF